MHRVWGWVSGFGRFWYGFIVGDDWTAAGGVLVMLGAAYGLLQAHIPAWWAGPVVITLTLLLTLWRAGQRHRAAQLDHAGDLEETPVSDRPVRNLSVASQRNQAHATEDSAIDVVQQIMADHHEQRRMFALLDELGDDPARLGPVWARLVGLLEVHADAEERLFYPSLLAAGQRTEGATSARQESKDASLDHDDIRAGICRSRQHPVGSSRWWQAVTETRAANRDHMAEEEREALPDFRRRATPQARHDLGIEFAVYQAAHPSGLHR